MSMVLMVVVVGMLPLVHFELDDFHDYIDYEHRCARSATTLTLTMTMVIPSISDVMANRNEN